MSTHSRVGLGRCGICVNLARRSGGSRFRIVVTEFEPDPAPHHDEDVVEVSVVVPSDAEVRWESWAAESLRTLGTIDGGAYRVRVSAHGRDAGHAGEFEDAIVDEYLTEFWKSPSSNDEVVRSGSADGAYWHQEIGGRIVAGLCDSALGVRMSRVRCFRGARRSMANSG